MDLNLHGFAGIRVADATDADRAAVEAELGPLPRGIDGEPDIVVQFVPRLETGALRLIGKDDAGFSDDAFYLLRGRRGAPVRTRIPMDAIGGPCEIVCESGGGGAPLLRQIVNVTALARGAVPVHGAAFEYGGAGALVTGWSRGGKTEALLAFMANGARYVGDEWTYLDPSGTRLHGTEEPVTLWDWNLDDLPDQRTVIRLRDRLRMRAVRAALARDGEGPLVRRGVALAERRGSARVEPARLFGADACVSACGFDRLFLAASHESDEVLVEPCDPADAARMVAACSAFEHRGLMEQYVKFRFAFPDRRNATLDRLEELYVDALLRAFAEKPAYLVTHPYPARIGSLYDAMREVM
jgi:hypothetical protein